MEIFDENEQEENINRDLGELIPKEEIDKYFDNDIAPSDLQELSKQTKKSTTITDDFIWQGTISEFDDLNDIDLDDLHLPSIYKTNITYPVDFDNMLTNILKKLDDVIPDIDENEYSDQDSISMNVLTFNHLQSVFSTYNWQYQEDICNNQKIQYFKKYKYIGLIVNRITIHNSNVNVQPDEYKIIFYTGIEGKCLAHCESELEVSNVLTIID